MAGTEINIPFFNWTAFYYAEILEALLQFMRRECPELTSESAVDPHIQLLRAFACVGHLTNGIADLTANEATLVTAKLAQSVRNHLRLIGYELAPSIPAQAEIVYELAQSVATQITIVPDTSQVATKANPGTATAYYEPTEEVNTLRTDLLYRFWAVEDGVSLNWTTAANTTADPLVPWNTPVGGSASREGDSLVFGHGQVMWSEVEITLTTPAAGLTGVWEYWDGNWQKTRPTAILLGGTYLVLDLTSYLGATNLQGTPIRVTFNDTGAYEDLFSSWDGVKNIVTTVGLLGQSSPSATLQDYTIGSAWERFSDLADVTANLQTGGKVTYTLPQNLEENWAIGEFEGTNGYWMRYRIISVATPTAPILDRVFIDKGKQYAKQLVVQGKTQNDNPLGSSNGTANQSFTSTKDGFIFNSDSVFVDDVHWTRVANFLASKPTDRHYTVELNAVDRPTFRFGDGTAGAIPTAGVANIRASYRYGANTNGNIGANTITQDQSGLVYINKLWNPRAASGWVESEAASPVSLERVKISGPASLRAGDVAIGPDDAALKILKASKEDPTLLTISRAFPIEGGGGDKTIELVVVPAGGALASPEQLAALALYFNGDKYSIPPKKKRIVANQQVVVSNYSQKTIDISVDIIGTVEADTVIAALTALLNPEARQADGVAYEWGFGDKVSLDRLDYEIWKVDRAKIKEVNILTPGSDQILGSRQLPIIGSVVVNVTAPS